MSGHNTDINSVIRIPETRIPLLYNYFSPLFRLNFDLSCCRLDAKTLCGGLHEKISQAGMHPAFFPVCPEKAKTVSIVDAAESISWI